MKNKIITSPMNDRNGSVGTDNNEMFLIKLKKNRSDRSRRSTRRRGSQKWNAKTG